MQRRLRSVLAPATALLALALVPLAPGASALAAPDTTALDDPSGFLRIDAPGKWRSTDAAEGITAVGFLGPKRAELFASVYADVTEAAAAAQRWRETRTAAGGAPTFVDDPADPLRCLAVSSSAGTVDYVRALSGRGRTAVVWVRLNGAPGVADADARAVLDAAHFREPEKPKETPPGGGEKPKPAGLVERDPAFRFEFALPAGFALRKDVTADARRAISAVGPVATDTEAYLDVYLLDAFLRVDAARVWWVESERRGWQAGVRIRDVAEGSTSFAVEVNGETWTRTVRIVETNGGIVGVKLDANSQVGNAAEATVQAVIDGITVRKERAAVPVPPPGMKSVVGPKVVVQTDAGDEVVKAFEQEADVVEEHVSALVQLQPLPGRPAVVRVYADATALENALRPLGVADGRAAYWWIAEGAVLTHAGAPSVPESAATLRAELARSALQRRFGFRPAWWLESGIADVVATSALEKGRVDVPHPERLQSARDAATGSVDFEGIRWWTEAESASRSERVAQAWAFVYFLEFGGPAGKKWEASFREYVRRLQATGDPEEAGKAFDFARDSELVDDWKKWLHKL